MKNQYYVIEAINDPFQIMQNILCNSKDEAVDLALILLKENGLKKKDVLETKKHLLEYHSFCLDYEYCVAIGKTINYKK